MTADTNRPADSYPEGKYANYCEISFNRTEFVLDFGQRYPSDDSWRCHSRLVLSPAYARQLLHVLDRSMRQFDADRPEPDETPS